MPNIIPILRSLGFLDSEVKTYLAALEMGPSTVLELNKKIGLSRQAIYTAIESLIKQGLMSSVEKGKKTLYAAESPERLRSFAEAKLKNMEATVREMKKVTDDLKLLEKGEKPVVKLYEGKDGYLAMLDEVLKAKPTEILEFTNEDAIEGVFTSEELKPHKQKLDAIGAHAKLLSKSSEPHGTRSTTKRRLITRKDIHFEGGISIIGSIVTLMTYKGKMIGVLIKSQVLADTMKELFRLAWDNEKK